MKKHTDDEFWALIVNTHPEMEGMAARITGNKQSSHDITYETLLKLWRIRDRMDSIENIKAFVYVTIRNSWLDTVKQSQRNKTFQLNETLENQCEEEDKEEETKKYLELMTLVKKVLDKMPVNYKTAILLKYFKSYSHKKIAVDMNVSEETARQYCCRGINYFRRVLKLSNYRNK